jgi:ABC-type amino acid transport substrate-binding protein
VKSLLIIMVLMLSVACTEAASRPVLRIATDATFAPFHLLDENGAPTGFDIELARAVATEAGFEPQVLVLPYDDLFSGLEENTHDMVAATTGITPERERIYLFSEPYFETCQVAVVRSGPEEPKSLAELSGLRIGAAGSGTSMKGMLTIEGAHIHLADGESLSSLLEGAVDAWIVDEFDGVTAARESRGRLRVLRDPVALERYGFVLPRDRQDLKRRLDQALAVIVERGEIAALQVRFGVERGPEWPVAW